LGIFPRNGLDLLGAGQGLSHQSRGLFQLSDECAAVGEAHVPHTGEVKRQHGDDVALGAKGLG